MNPELMLYDEPTTGLDPIMSDVINELMMRTRRSHPVTSVIVSHDMRTARKVADRVVMLYPLARLQPDEPQVIFDGPPSELDRTDDRRVIAVRARRGRRTADGNAGGTGGGAAGMDERVIRFRVGVVVVASAIITVVLVMLFGAGANVLQRHYTLHIMFPEAPGITVDTPVRKSGVLIGRVSEVQLIDQGGVRVSARSTGNTSSGSTRSARIGSGSLLGDAVVEFVPAAQERIGGAVRPEPGPAPG